MTRSTSMLSIAHLIGNALLLYIGYRWLGMGESDGPHLAASIAVLLVFIFGALWLHGTTFAYFDRAARLNFRHAALRCFRHLLPLLTLAVTAAAIYVLLAWWRDSFQHRAFVIGSYTTMTLRKPVSPSAVERWFHAFIWILRWVIVPVFFLPLAAGAALEGWAGIRWHSLRPLRRVTYWLEAAALLLCAIWVPLKLVHWVPHIDSFSGQVASLVVRLGMGYLLFIAALLSLEFFTSSGRPRVTQVNTASTP
jgi:hypothetical protein